MSKHVLMIVPVFVHPEWGFADDFYAENHRAAMETWDSREDPFIDVVYVKFGPETRLDGNVLYVPNIKKPEWRDSGVDIPMLDFLLQQFQFNHLVMTTASSYWNKRYLYDKILTLPMLGCAAAVPNFYLSGAGCILSRDVVMYLVSHGAEWDYGTNADLAMSKIILPRYQSLPLIRQDYDDPCQVTDGHLLLHYHFRCKKRSEDQATIYDVPIIRKVHEAHERMFS